MRSIFRAEASAHCTDGMHDEVIVGIMMVVMSEKVILIFRELLTLLSVLKLKSGDHEGRGELGVIGVGKVRVGRVREGCQGVWEVARGKSWSRGERNQICL